MEKNRPENKQGKIIMTELVSTNIIASLLPAWLVLLPATPMLVQINMYEVLLDA